MKLGSNHGNDFGNVKDEGEWHWQDGAMVVFEDDRFPVDIPVLVGFALNSFDAVLKDGNHQVEEQHDRDEDVHHSYKRDGKFDHVQFVDFSVG